jgi:hypothetical protein
MITALEAADVSDPDQSEMLRKNPAQLLDSNLTPYVSRGLPTGCLDNGNVDQEWRSATSQSNLDRLLEALI